MSDKKKLLVGITQGDSNGIGYEVIIKALSDERILDQLTPVVYGSPKLFSFYEKTIPEIEKQLTLNVISDAKDARPKVINLVNCLPDSVYAEPGGPTPESAQHAITAIERAVQDAKDGKIDVVVTGPINKKSMSLQGFKFPGHTEYFQNAFGKSDVAMFMVSSRLMVGVVTGHMPLKEVPSSITEDKILSQLRLLNASLRQDFCIDEPRIGVLSLNPHSGDGGLLGDEEQNVILPAIAKAQAEGIQAFGAYSPDGYFGLGTYEHFDATLAMYHDQGLAPFKSIAFSDGVNFTAGLPIVRTSPDHGTAYEKAGRDEADASSMRAAIYAAVDIWHKRREWEELQKSRVLDK